VQLLKALEDAAHVSIRVINALQCPFDNGERVLCEIDDFVRPAFS
jgi:hypothetical protein